MSSSALSLQLAPGWSQADVTAEQSKVLSGAVAAAGPGGSGLVAGDIAGTVAARRFMGVEGTTPTGARLGRIEAWRYAGLRPLRGVDAVGYLAPTTGGALLVICYADRPGAAAGLAQCARMASTIALDGADPIPLSEVEGRRQDLTKALSTLGRQRRAARERLAQAELASVQAGSARGLERMYTRAARETEKAGAPELVRALRATARSYRKLAAAAANRNRSRYRAATRAVNKNEAKVQDQADAALAAL